MQTAIQCKLWDTEQRLQLCNKHRSLEIQTNSGQKHKINQCAWKIMKQFMIYHKQHTSFTKKTLHTYFLHALRTYACRTHHCRITMHTKIRQKKKRHLNIQKHNTGTTMTHKRIQPQAIVAVWIHHRGCKTLSCCMNTLWISAYAMHSVRYHS